MVQASEPRKDRMKTIELVMGVCPDCGEQIHPAKTQAEFNRTLGLHMRNAHGKVGKWRQRYKKHRNGPMEEPAIPKSVEEKKREELRQYKREWWDRNKHRLYKYKKRGTQAAAEPTPSATQVDPCKLSECPNCGTRFYMIKGA